MRHAERGRLGRGRPPRPPRSRGRAGHVRRAGSRSDGPSACRAYASSVESAPPETSTSTGSPGAEQARARDGRADAARSARRRAPCGGQAACVGGSELDVASVQALGLVVVAGCRSRAHAPLHVGEPQLEPAAQGVLAAQLVRPPGAARRRVASTPRAGPPGARRRPPPPPACASPSAAIGRSATASQAGSATCGHGPSAARAHACTSARSNSSAKPSPPSAASRTSPLSSGVRARSTSPPQSGQR